MNKFVENFKKLYTYTNMSTDIADIDIDDESDMDCNLVVNENGALLRNTTKNPCIDAFHKIIRGVKDRNINDYIKTIINHANIHEDYSLITDLFVLIFHKRNCRGGEGEKALSYKMLLNMYKEYPETTVQLIQLFPVYGYYKDYFELWEMICKLENISSLELYVTYGPLVDTLVKLIVEQFVKDESNLESGQISLLGKWLPRQKSHYDKTCYWFNGANYDKKINSSLYLASNIYKQSPFKNGEVNKWILMNYRKRVTKLTQKLKVPEVFMCAKKYSEIDFTKVPSKAMKTYTKAFLNEKLKDSNMNATEEETGNRYPNDADRIKSRNNIKKIIIDGMIQNIKGAQLDPHEIMNKLIHSKSKLEIELLRAQWESKKKDVLAQLNEMKEKEGISGSCSGNGIGKCIPMIDVSGSMCGKGIGSNVEPIHVAVALGIMTSELASDPFKDLAISFTENPHMFTFYQKHPDDKCNIIMRDEVGYSTKFDRAIDLILEMCVKNQIPSEDIPNLLVFTDGQFDQMNNQPQNSVYGPVAPSNNKKSSGNENVSWKTSHELLVKKWVDAGYDRVPTIIYWNLRANTPGIQTLADYPGVQMLQGYSASLLKFVLFGEEFDEKFTDVETENGVVKVKTCKVTPNETFRKVIDQECYNKVRDILARSSEKLYRDQIPPLSPCPCIVDVDVDVKISSPSSSPIPFQENNYDSSGSSECIV